MFITLLEMMDAFISESNLKDARLQHAPWIINSVPSKAVDRQVSLDNAQDYINAYQFYTGDQDILSAKQLVSLLDNPDDSPSPSFNLLDKWLQDNGKAKVSIYQQGIRAAYLVYEISEQKKHADKDLSALTAHERLELAQWALANPDAGASLSESEKKDYETLLNISQQFCMAQSLGKDFCKKGFPGEGNSFFL